MAQEHRLLETDFRHESLEFARRIMRKAKAEFERIALTLVAEGFRFSSLDGPIKKPDPNTSIWVSDLRHRNIHIPLVLEAWLAEVGGVNFMGSHPEWSAPGYCFGNKPDPAGLLFTDAFVCELTAEYVEYLYEEWQSDESATLTPFRIDFSPDHLHKANISGGLPYQMSAGRPSIDSIVLNERHCTSFMGLVRLALQWRGFPGFDDISNEGTWSKIGPKLV